MKINSIGVINDKSNRFNKTNIIQKQNTKDNLNKNNYIIPYYQNIPFKRSWHEHKSWGAVYNPDTKSTNFKIFTFPDAKSVDVEILHDDEYVSYPLKNMGNGIFQTESEIKNAKEGDKYHYVIRKSDDSTEIVKDPYSLKQPELNGDSVIYNQNAYNWNDEKWYSEDKSRVSRLANSNNELNTVNNLKIYEINCASLTSGGDFDSAKESVKKAHKNGFNAIEIMPVENTYSFNWGYDGVDKFAVSEYLGGPDKLKELIDYSHQIGMNVIMDVVPNHLGPDGASLQKTGPYIKGVNAFGYAFNFENQNSTYVRDYIVNASLNWIDNFHCDGLRLDMTKFMDSDITMKQIALEVNYHKPEAFIIAEDARSNVETDGNYFWTNHEKLHDERVIYKLPTDEVGYNDESHNNIVENIMSTSVAKLGFDSEWDFDLFHSLSEYLFTDNGLHKLENAIYSSLDRVKYIMSHDEIGNCDGTRLIPKLMAEKLNLNRYIVLDENDTNRINNFAELRGVSHNEARRIVIIQKAQFTAEKLATILQSGELNSNDDIYNLGIDRNSNYTVDDIKRAYEESFSKQKAALALVYAIPGPKMVFQGDESASLTPFRFFREFSDNSEEYILTTEKGYKAGKSALEESKPDKINYSKPALKQMRQYSNLMNKLNRFPLSMKYIDKNYTILHPYSKVLAFNLSNDENEMFVVSNLSDSKYPSENANEYYINFPEGEWVEVLNTDDKKYSGTGLKNTNHVVSNDNYSKVPITLPANSTLYFKKL